MTLKGTSRCELTKLMSNHILCYVYRNMLSAIVHSDCVTDELREDSGRTGPSLENFLLILFIHCTNTVEELNFNIRCFL